MKQTYNQTGLATIIILAGIVLLLSNLELIPVDVRKYLFTWQVALIFGGSAILVIKYDKVPGLLLITTGLFFLLPEILDIHFLDPRVYWPMILIVVGLVLIPGIRYSRTKREQNENR